MIEFISLESKLPSQFDQGEMHKSSLGITDESVRVCGVILHNSEIVATENNVMMLRKLADILESRLIK